MRFNSRMWRFLSLSNFSYSICRSISSFFNEAWRKRRISSASYQSLIINLQLIKNDSYFKMNKFHFLTLYLHRYSTSCHRCCSHLDWWWRPIDLWLAFLNWAFLVVFLSLHNSVDDVINFDVHDLILLAHVELILVVWKIRINIVFSMKIKLNATHLVISVKAVPSVQFSTNVAPCLCVTNCPNLKRFSMHFCRACLRSSVDLKRKIKYFS